MSLFRRPSISKTFSSRRQDETIMNVFDRKAKRKQKNRAALAADVAVYDYLKDEVSQPSEIDRVKLVVYKNSGEVRLVLSFL